MASFLTRRLLNPKSLSLLPKSPIPLKPSLANSILTFHPKPVSLNPFFLPNRNLCSNSHSNSNSNSNPKPTEQQQQQPLKHQEIEGPTVDRDLSPLANETREILDKTRKSIYNLSNSLALLGVANLTLGAWTVFNSPHGLPHEVSVQGIASFAFPFATAFVMRRSLKPMGFFRKMEEIGRLQILTLALQQVKGVDLLLRRTRVVVLFCVLGVSAGSIAVVLTR
ncbi:hypothetical protein LUZ60_000049 [Juncus effusus]|nr:hypothetical protein LUZ60_000049 [Juncus effusus]